MDGKRAKMNSHHVAGEGEKLLHLGVGDFVNIVAQREYFTTSLILEKQGYSLFELSDTVICQAFYVDGVLDGELYVADIDSCTLLAGYVVSKGIVQSRINLDLVDDVIDLSDHGSRWEGEVCRDTREICGWGSAYNDEGLLKYVGFCIHGVYSLFGSIYSEDNSVPEYVGMVMNGVPFGRGRKMDRSSDVICDTVFINNSREVTIVTVPPLVDSSFMFSSELEVLSVHNYSFGPFMLDFSFFTNLRTVQGSSHSFLDAQEVLFANLPAFESFSLVYTDADSEDTTFYNKAQEISENDPSLVFRNCPKLETIDIGNESFASMNFIIARRLFHWDLT